MRARLMGISENYDDEVERQNTQPGLLPPQECTAPTMSTEYASLLTKAGALKKDLAITNGDIQRATKITQFAVAALLLRAVTS